MRLTSLLLAILICPIITACSSSGADDYRKLVASSTQSNTYTSPSNAIQKTAKKPFPLNNKKKIAFRIGKQPTFLDQGITNSFEAFSLQFPESGKYQLEAAGPCYECLGFRKKVFYPKVTIYNKNYQPIVSESANFNSSAYTSYIEKSFHIPKADTYYMLISSDNHKMRDIATGTGYARPPGQQAIPLSLPVSTSPEGNAFVEIKKFEPKSKGIFSIF